MNLERGFLRIVLILSVAVLLASLAVVWIISDVASRSSDTAESGKRKSIEEDLADIRQQQSTPGVRIIDRSEVPEEIRKRAEAAPRGFSPYVAGREKRPGEIIINHSGRKYIGPNSSLTPEQISAYMDNAVAEFRAEENTRKRVQVWTVGGLLSLCVASVPWLLFFLVRWIARGFSARG